MKQKMKNVLAGCLLAALVFAAIPPIAASATTYGGPEQDFAIPVVAQTTVPAGYTGIYTTADLDNIRNDLGGKYILMNDIVFSDADFQVGGAFYNSGNGWIPIGNGVVDAPFTGILDGNGFAIYGIKAEYTAKDDTIQVGLIGESQGQVKNLAMDQTSFTIGDFGVMGSIAVNNLGQINNCMTFGEVAGSSVGPSVASDNTVGGVCGVNRGTVSYTTNYCSVDSCDFTGGIAGNNFGEIEYCANFGQITSSKGWDLGSVGGIAGINQKTISKCYNTGIVIGRDEAGGIVGVNEATTKNCFNTGLVETTRLSSATFDTYAAGIAGIQLSSAIISNCYSTGQLSGAGSNPILCGINGQDVPGAKVGLDVNPPVHSYYLDTTGNNDFGTALTYAEMASKSSYVGFDFTNVWVMSPTLKRPVLRGFLPDTCDITYELNGGSLPSSAPTAYMDGSNRLLPTPAKEGFSFQGWYTDASLDGKAVRVVPDGSTGTVQYFAKWGPVANDNQNPQNNIDGNPDTGDRQNDWLLYGALIGSLLLLAMKRWWYNKATE
jgi:uncharacterized repeat protein (TIGR02543 family)